MGSHRLVSFRLADSTLAALTDAARSDGRVPADLIRAAIARDMARRCPNRAPDPAAVAAAVEGSKTWHDLQKRLRAIGTVLRLLPEGTLALNAWPSDLPLGPAADWGLDRLDLSLRFRAAFPGTIAETGLPVGNALKAESRPEAN